MNLRVLMIAPTPFFGDRGCHVRIMEEIRALGEAGVRVLLLTYPGGKSPPDISIRRIKGPDFLKEERIGPHAGKYILDASMVIMAVREAKSYNPDIIHGHLHEGCLIGWFAGKILNKPVVFDYQGSLAGEMAHHGFLTPGSLPFAAFRSIERVINRLPDVVLSSSGAMLDGNFKRNGVEVRIVPDAVDMREFSPLEKDAKLASSLGLPSDRPICAFLGLLNRYQGVDMLLESVAVFKAQYGPKAHFLVMGYPGVERYEFQAASLGIKEMVTFTGRLPYDMAPTYLNLGDMAIAPKIAATESNGKIIDYMACGLATVALDTGVNREILGETGLYVVWREREKETAVGIADAVAKLAEDESLRKKLGRMGRERAEKLFNRENLAKKLLDAYQSVKDE